MRDDKTPRDLLDWLGITDAPHWWVARPLGPLFAMVLAVLLALALVAAFAVLLHTVAMARSGASEGINLGAGALIVALLGAPFLIWSMVLKHQTLRYQKEGHITDRINKAVEQLGAEKTIKKAMKNADGSLVLENDGKPKTIELTEPNIEVRIGAILSLERIAQDSTRYDRGRDHVRVMEILCAYVRENSNARLPQEFPGLERESQARNTGNLVVGPYLRPRQERPAEDSFESQVRALCQKLPSLRIDVVLAMLVLGRRTAEQRKVEAAWPDPPDQETVWPFDLPLPQLPKQSERDRLRPTSMASYSTRLDAWIRRTDEYKGYRLNLEGANLQGIRLIAERPDGSDMVFSGAILAGARLECAELRRIRLQGSDLSEAHLHAAKLEGSHLEGTTFRGAHMQIVDLAATNCQGASFSEASMQRVELLEANMQCASLFAANMQGASLCGADLTWADMNRAIFDERTVWSGAKLRGADFSEVDLSHARIEPFQLPVAFGDWRTQLRDSRSRPQHWPNSQLPAIELKAKLAAWRMHCLTLPEQYLGP